MAVGRGDGIRDARRTCAYRRTCISTCKPVHAAMRCSVIMPGCLHEERRGEGTRHAWVCVCVRVWHRAQPPRVPPKGMAALSARPARRPQASRQRPHFFKPIGARAVSGGCLHAARGNQAPRSRCRSSRSMQCNASSSDGAAPDGAGLKLRPEQNSLTFIQRYQERQRKHSPGNQPKSVELMHEAFRPPLRDMTAGLCRTRGPDQHAPSSEAKAQHNAS